MAFYDIQTHDLFQSHSAMLHGMNDIFTDQILDSMLQENISTIGQIDYQHDNMIPVTHDPPIHRSPTHQYTEVFRASDMNTAATCVNGIQHFSSPPMSPPVSPDTVHDDSGDIDTDCTSCVKCRETATQKRARRREQNRQSQRKFRARKEAKLSDAKARIRDLEALIRAQEKTNIGLKLTIEELNSRQSTADASTRRKAMAYSDNSVSVDSKNQWERIRGTSGGQSDMTNSLSLQDEDIGTQTQRSHKKN